MATTIDAGPEMRLGLMVALAVLAVGGALVMLVRPGDPLAGWGFGAAMLAATLAVAAAHVGG